MPKGPSRRPRRCGKPALPPTAPRPTLRRRQSVDRLVQETVARTGRIDILVNNAGVVSNTPILDLSEEEWDRTMAVNLKGVFVCSQSVGAGHVRSSGRAGS